jgi:hypothetical protein
MKSAKDPRTIMNRPGLSALSYRIGDYAAFRHDLLAQLSQRLPNLKTRDPDDAAIALLDAWAVVADVLTFYQERIANEGYLNTATERQSLIELARLIGYELKPGVSASTYLAFTLEEKPGEPTLVMIPKGTQAMSIPGEGEVPQLFETSEDLLTSYRWNALTPRLSQPQTIRRSTHSLYVQGISLPLAAGDWVLLTGTQDQAETTILLNLTTVEPNPTIGTTLLAWDYDLEPLDAKSVLRHPQLFAFRLRAGLFGNTAPRWEAVPNEVKQQSPGVQVRGGVFVTVNPTDPTLENIQWHAQREGLPSQDILCLANRQTFYFAGTEDKGIFRWNAADPTNSTWQPINNGLTNLSVQSLYVMDEARGYLLAGTPTGGVFRSKDNGETWSPIGTGNTRLHKKSGDDEVIYPVLTGIPNVVVRSLLSYTIGQTAYIFAGTDDDIYRTTNQGQDWSSSKIPSTLSTPPEYQALAGLPNKVIYALLKVPEQVENITGTIKEVAADKKQVTLEGLNKTLKKGDAVTIEGQTRNIAEINSIVIQLDQAFGSEINRGTTFTTSTFSGIINSVENEELQITQLGYIPRRNDQITAAGQTQTIANVRDFVITAILEVEAALPLGISPGTDFEALKPTGESISGKIRNARGQTVEIYQANGILEVGDRITVASVSRLITGISQDAITATVELQAAFQPEVKDGDNFTTSNQAQGKINTLSEQQVTVEGVIGRLQVGDTFTASQQDRKITQIESLKLTLERPLDLSLMLNVEKLDDLTQKPAYGTAIRIFAGTDQGIYYSEDHGTTWSPEPAQASSNLNLVDQEIYTLDFYEFNHHNYVLAGTSIGIWRCQADQESLSWTPVVVPDTSSSERVASTDVDGSGDDSDNSTDDIQKLAEGAVRSLRVLKSSDNTYVFAGTAEGVFRGELAADNTWAWDPIAKSSVIKGIISLATGAREPQTDNDSEASKLVLAGARFLGFTEATALPAEPDSLPPEQTEWPNFYIQNNQIDLDAVYPKVLPDSWMVLVNQSQAAQMKTQALPPHLPVRVEEVSTEQRKGFTLDSKITRVLPDRSDRRPHPPEAFNPRSTLVLAQSEALPLAGISLTVPIQQTEVFQAPLRENKIELSTYVHGLTEQKPVIVSGQHIRAKVEAGGVFRSRNWQLLSADLSPESIQALVLREGDGALFALTKTGVWQSQDNGQHWIRLPQKGLEGSPGSPPGVSIHTIAIYSQPFEAKLSSQGNRLLGRLPTQTSPAIASPAAALGTESQDIDAITNTRGVFGVDIKIGDTVSVVNQRIAGRYRQTRLIVNILDPRKLLLNAGFGVNLAAGTNTDKQINRLLVGTDQGIYRLVENSDPALSEWVSLSQHESATALRQVHVIRVRPQDGAIVVGTRQQGVFISWDSGETWTPEPLPTGEENVLSLAFNRQGDILAGTQKHGVWRLPYQAGSGGPADSAPARSLPPPPPLVQTTNWQSISANLADFPVVSLVVEPERGDVFAGTATGGVFRLPATAQTTAAEPTPRSAPEGSVQPLILLDPQDPEAPNWTALNDMLPDRRILTLYLDDSSQDGQPRYLVAGTKEQGVFRLPLPINGLPVWESISVGLGDRPVQSFAISAQNYLLAGTTAGIFRTLHPERDRLDLYWEHSNRGLTYNNVQALISYRLKNQLRLFAGTRAGVFRSFNQGQNWELMNQGLRNPEVQALLSVESPSGSDPQVQLLAGTKEGLFASFDEGKTWYRVNVGRVRPSIQALVQGKTYIFAGTLNTGLFRSSDQGKTWVEVGLLKQDIRVLLFQDEDLWVGTAGNGIWRSPNNGNTWEHWINVRSGSGQLASDGVTVTGTGTQFQAELQPGDRIEVEGQIRTVAGVSSDQELTVDEAFKPALQSQTFIIHTGLENLYITALAVFENDLYAGTAGSGVFRTELPLTRQNQRWETVNGRVTDEDGKRVNRKLTDLEVRCLTVGPVPQGAYLYAGTATGGVFQLSKPTAVGDWEVVSPGLTNTDVRAMVFTDSNLYLGGIGILSSLDGGDFVELQPDDLLRVVTVPTEVILTDGQVEVAATEGDGATEPTHSQRAQVWQVMDRDNFLGQLIIPQADDITLFPAAADDPVVSELAAIQAPPDDEDAPVLTLASPLKKSYDPASVRIYANVVEATHGETVEEILGSGNGAEVHQTFALSKPPLTHVAAAVASGSESALKVYVNGVAWTQEPSLYPLDKQDRSYILRIEDDGTTTITFGDGQRGARLPSGEENITAVYRSGLGPDGNVGTGQIALKKTGPPSLQKVINPLPAEGGAAKESIASARTAIPATTRTLDRIVSRQDFEDFTQAFAGIGKAQAVTLWNGTSELVHITIAATGGQVVSPDSGLYRSLVQGIDAVLDPFQPLHIASFGPRFFILA